MSSEVKVLMFFLEAVFLGLEGLCKLIMGGFHYVKDKIYNYI
jgi:hypothetical protein